LRKGLKRKSGAAKLAEKIEEDAKRNQTGWSRRRRIEED
jgi:hypothetical protein